MDYKSLYQNLFGRQNDRPTTDFEIICYLKSKAEQHKQICILYEKEIERQLQTGSFNYYVNTDINLPNVTFTSCNDHIYVKDKVLYKCINCAKEKILDQCNIQLPTEILVNIFRSDKLLFHLSRTVSKSIRNASLSDILQNEMLYPLTNSELDNLCDLNRYTRIEKHIESDAHQGGYDEYMIMFATPCGNVNNNKILYYKGIIHQDYDGAVTTSQTAFSEITEINYRIIKSISECQSHTYDVDFISFYHLMFNRLAHFTCDVKTIALSLTLKKFDKLKASIYNKPYFLLHLYATAAVLSIEMSIKTKTIEELIDIYEPQIREKLQIIEMETGK